MSNSLNQTRLQLAALGYAIIPTRGKIARFGWNDRDYAARELTASGKGSVADKVLRWPKRFPDQVSTGVRIEGGLGVIDIDVNDPLAAVLLDAIGEIAPEISARAPTRYGGGEHKVALFVRIEGELFIKVESHKYIKPGNDDEDLKVEIFGGKPWPNGRCSRQFGIYGPHSFLDDGSVAVEYCWAEGWPALHEVALADLPALSKETALAILARFEELAEAAGWTRLKSHQESDSSSQVYDITAETRFAVLHGSDNVDYGELCDLHDIKADVRVASSFIEGDSGHNRNKCWVFWSKRHECVAVYDHEERVSHFPVDMKPAEQTVADDLGPKLKQLAADSGVTLLPPWPRFELMQKGGIKVSMPNARLGIEWLGVVCSHDTFHSKLWIGRSDAAPPLEKLPHYIGEMTDARLLELRGALHDTFRVDFGERNVRDAAMRMAGQNMFDPVAQMLDEAQQNWDGKQRLDRMAPDYFNTADTRLMQQMLRKVMIAAVARVRNPGCKFDTIPVFESPEGFNKSTAWLVLAGGQENFSDEAIIGRNTREVQEQLAGIWIHENAELAGMTKAEVDMVTAFASRQVDRARPAYGRFLVEQPRHSVEIGTTNADVYLQKQTGNRRFWPMKVHKSIDLAKLRRDRLQLWGEAAAAQAAGESLVLDESLWAEAAVLQEEARVSDIWEDVLAGLSRVAPIERPAGVPMSYHDRHIIHVDGSDEVVATATIFEQVLYKLYGVRSDYNTARRLAMVMKSLGWKRDRVTISGVQVRGYRRSAKLRVVK